MAESVEDGRKKLQIAGKLQKREDERIQNIQQRKTIKEDEVLIHVCTLSFRFGVESQPQRVCLKTDVTTGQRLERTEHHSRLAAISSP